MMIKRIYRRSEVYWRDRETKENRGLKQWIQKLVDEEGWSILRKSEETVVFYKE